MYWEAQTWVMKIYISQVLMISSCGIKWGNSHSLSPEVAIIGSELGTYRCNILRDRHNLSFRQIFCNFCASYGDFKKIE